MPYRVTFVCTGNICRSPMAEHVFRKHADGLDIEVDSSGTGNWHVGSAADPRTVAALERAGYTSEHSARYFDPAWFDHYDLIIALDRGHLRDLTALAPSGTEHKIHLLREFDPTADSLNVEDPYYSPDPAFDEVREQIEAAVPGLLDHIERDLKERGQG